MWEISGKSDSVHTPLLSKHVCPIAPAQAHSHNCPLPERNKARLLQHKTGVCRLKAAERDLLAMETHN